MSDAAALLRQRARLFAEQQKKRAATVKASDTAPPLTDGGTQQQLQPPPLQPVLVKRESVVDLFASAATNGADTEDAAVQQARYNHKRPPPSLDEPLVNVKKLKTDQQPPPPVAASSSADIDPLDAYIANLSTTLPPTTPSHLRPPTIQPANSTAAVPSIPNPTRERYYADDEGALDEDELDRISASTPLLDEPTSKLKKKQLEPVDHSAQHYIDIRKDFWLESPDISRLSDDEVVEMRRDELEGVKIRGKRCPRPFREWRQCGLLEAVMDVIRASGYTKPFPIQAQAIPAIMSGRDVIACAKTGSGKTLAYLLPLLRHVKDQPPLEEGEGPIGLILGPTRELAVQVYTEAKKFAKAVGLRVVCVYGGSGVAEQIAGLKRGSDVIVATPGRLIDMLCANNGRVLSLRRTSFVVLDEADRMFDMGFEPQITKVLQLIRPDRQLVMFSATFPASIEKLARKTLKDGLEIVIGGRSVASDSVTQYVEVRKAEDKWPRLLEILGQWYAKGSIIVFVDKQEAVDNLFRQLIDNGYPCLALHGGMDQQDRDFTLSDFKAGHRTLLIATSVVARGLDVKDCVLVINYTTPNHYEDYVHRVGRTGRAGRTGTAITLIQPDEQAIAVELVRGLKESKQVVPQDLEAMAAQWLKKRKAGDVKWGVSGFGGKGFRFDEVEEAERREKERVLRLQFNPEADQAELAQLQDELKEREEDKRRKEAEQQATGQSSSPAVTSTAPSSASAPLLPMAPPVPSAPLDPIARQIAAARAAAAAAAQSRMSNETDAQAAQAAKEAKERAEKKAAEDAADRAKAVALALTSKSAAAAAAANPAASSAASAAAKHSAIVDINDYPQQARWAVTKKGSLDDIVGETGCAVTAKGTWHANARRGEGEGAAGGGSSDRLHLLIEGLSEVDVLRCRNEIVRRLEEAKAEVEAKEAAQFGMGGGGGRGRYNVL